MKSRGPKESETCREYVVPRLKDSGWLRDQIHPQYPITAGRVVFRGRRPYREEELRADYALEVSPGFPIAVVEAKREYAKPADGLQQAKEYAELLDLPIALASNGKGIIEFDFYTGLERTLDRFPRPDEIWERFRAWKGITDNTVAEILREPFNRCFQPEQVHWLR